MYSGFRKHHKNELVPFAIPKFYKEKIVLDWKRKKKSQNIILYLVKGSKDLEDKIPILTEHSRNKNKQSSSLYK